MQYLSNAIYINLDERKDRREHTEKEFDKIGITPIRFSAIKLDNHAAGCSMSHIKSLRLAKEKFIDFAFICEDDITFTNPSLLMTNLENFIQDGQNWDVIIICGNNYPPYKKISNYAVKVYNCFTTAGYIIKINYIDTLIKNMRESVEKLLREPKNTNYCLDVYWKKLQCKDNWFMIVPATVLQYPNFSDIEQKYVDYQQAILEAEKYLYI